MCSFSIVSKHIPVSYSKSIVCNNMLIPQFRAKFVRQKQEILKPIPSFLFAVTCLNIFVKFIQSNVITDDELACSYYESTVNFRSCFSLEFCNGLITK